MGLEIKSVDQIFTSLLTWITTGTEKLTDFNIGSATRALLESVSLQEEEFYFDLQQAVTYAIDNAIYDAFGFAKYKSEKATGEVTITFNRVLPANIVITKGTTLSTNIKSDKVVKFQVTQNTEALAGSVQMTVPVECLTDGYIGNIEAYSITSVSPSNPYFDSVFNEHDFYDGQDEETNAQRKLRFKQYIRSLQRGTREAIEYGARTVKGVAGVYVDDSYIGFVRVYVHDVHGNLSDELKTQVILTLDEWRAAGIEVEVLPIITLKQSLDIQVIFVDTADINVYTKNIKEVVENFLNSFQVSDNLYLSNLIATIMEAYRDVVIDTQIINGEDVFLNKNELIRADKINIVGVHKEDWRI